MTPLFNKLSVARRAGKIVCGFDRVKESVAAGTSFLVLTASDLSPKSLKEVLFFCQDTVPCVPVEETVAMFGDGIGFQTGIVSVEDEGFAKAIQSVLQSREYGGKNR